MPGIAARTCRNHPDRPALAVCMRCRAAVCGDCTTKLQGVNHCVNCLEKRAEAADATPRSPAAWLWVGGGVLGTFLILWLAIYGTTYVFLHL